MQVSENEIINILTNRDILLDTIRRKREELLAESNEIEEAVIRQISLSGKPLKADVLSKTNDNKENILKILEKSKEERILLANAIERQLDLLFMEEQMINRVWIAYRRTDSLDYRLLEALYIKNEKQELICMEFNISKATLNRRRKTVINNLQKIIYSGGD